MVAEWWFKSTCGHNSSKKGIRRFFLNVLDDTRKFGSVPIMVLERLAKPPGVYSPCRFESYTLRFGQITLPASRWSMFRMNCIGESRGKQSVNREIATLTERLM